MTTTQKVQYQGSLTQLIMALDEVRAHHLEWNELERRAVAWFSRDTLRFRKSLEAELNNYTKDEETA